MARLPDQVATRRAHFAHVLVADLHGAGVRAPGLADVPDACARDCDAPHVAGCAGVGGGFASPRVRFCDVFPCHDGHTFSMDLWAETTPCLKGMCVLPGCTSVTTGQWLHRRRQRSPRRCFERRRTCSCKTDEAPRGDGAPAPSTPPRGRPPRAGARWHALASEPRTLARGGHCGRQDRAWRPLQRRSTNLWGQIGDIEHPWPTRRHQPRHAMLELAHIPRPGIAG